MRTNVYIDASNLFYGGEKSLGWKIDYKKLYEYLKERYQISKIFFFGGVETHTFPFDYQTMNTVSIGGLEKHILESLNNIDTTAEDAVSGVLSKHLSRISFYRKLEEFGYTLVLKPVKIFNKGKITEMRKANCDTDMALYMLADQDMYDRVIVMSGDGDFLPILKFLREENKDVMVFARGPRTAFEIKQFAGDKFLDFNRLQSRLEWVPQK